MQVFGWTVSVRVIVHSTMNSVATMGACNLWLFTADWVVGLLLRRLRSRLFSGGS
jgi:hypothetical protein